MKGQVLIKYFCIQVSKCPAYNSTKFFPSRLDENRTHINEKFKFGFLFFIFNGLAIFGNTKLILVLCLNCLKCRVIKVWKELQIKVD